MKVTKAVWAELDKLAKSPVSNSLLFDAGVEFIDNRYEQPEVLPSVVAFLDRQDSRRLAAWTVSQQRGKRTDYARKCAERLMESLDATLEAGSVIASACGLDADTVVSDYTGQIPVMYLNPDGRRFVSRGNPMQAKMAYEKRHKLSIDYRASVIVKHTTNGREAIVSIERRKDMTSSSYYDPTPNYEDALVNGEVISRYRYSDSQLMLVPKDGVFEGHRLTVLEYEGAVLRGAFDSLDLALGGDPGDFQVDFTPEDEEMDSESWSSSYRDPRAEELSHDPRDMEREDTRYRTYQSLSWDEQLVYDVLVEEGFAGDAGRLLAAPGQGVESAVTQRNHFTVNRCILNMIGLTERRVEAKKNPESRRAQDRLKQAEEAYAMFDWIHSGFEEYKTTFAS